MIIRRVFMFVHITLYWSQSPAQVQFKAPLLQIWGSLPRPTCDNQGLGWTKLARRLARAQRQQISTMQVGGTHNIHTIGQNLSMQKKTIQNLVQYGQNPFRWSKQQFLFQRRASQPTSTYFSYHKFTRRISQVCIMYCCNERLLEWGRGGLKPNCSSRQDSCVESSQSLAASRVPGGRYSLVLGTRKKWKLKILELSRKLHQRFCLMCRDQKVGQRISKFKKNNKGAKPSAKLRTECLMFLNLSNSNFPLLPATQF